MCCIICSHDGSKWFAKNFRRNSFFELKFFFSSCVCMYMCLCMYISTYAKLHNLTKTVEDNNIKLESNLRKS